MKKLISICTILTIAFSNTVYSASSSKNVSNPHKVALITNYDGIDEKSFNQYCWEGMKLFQEKNEGATKSAYIQPEGESEEDYLIAYANLVAAGHETIISPGFRYETAVHKAQSFYPNINFVIIDGTPHDGDYEPDIGLNTESIYFVEEEAGFYAGVVAALSSETDKVSFIGGMEIPPVEKFGWGYVAGVAYANAMYDTDVVVNDYIYQGTFTDVNSGKVLASHFYDKGSDIIFAAAGGVGIGVIYEGKERRTNGEDVWVVGIDSDQYEDGEISNGDSVILTSVIKNISAATYTAIDEIITNDFKGGQSIILDSTRNGVGLPLENPNLSKKALNAYNMAFDAVANGDVVVPTSIDELETFLGEYNYETPDGVEY